MIKTIFTLGLILIAVGFLLLPLGEGSVSTENKIPLQSDPPGSAIVRGAGVVVHNRAKFSYAYIDFKPDLPMFPDDKQRVALPYDVHPALAAHVDMMREGDVLSEEREAVYFRRYYIQPLEAQALYEQTIRQYFQGSMSAFQQSSRQGRERWNIESIFLIGASAAVIVKSDTAAGGVSQGLRGYEYLLEVNGRWLFDHSGILLRDDPIARPLREKSFKIEALGSNDQGI